MKVFLLDADVIIWCAESAKLDSLFKNRTIILPQIILDEVIHKVDPVTQEKSGIDLDKYMVDGSLKTIDCDVSQTVREISETYKKCPELAEIGNGEIECIALLRVYPNYGFCTGDISAMKVIGYWGLSEQAISLEELLGKIRELRYNFTKECMDKYLKIGTSLRVQYLEDL